ncbi:MAG TPA: prolyl oligopeptidase family serine peptidase [Candidatus Sulfotelmatobacter sp.]|nr:prolyl oligopeptidase family serine peptidase [Candidatus Sulfotelmatobacter sp.]
MARFAARALAISGVQRAKYFLAILSAIIATLRCLADSGPAVRVGPCLAIESGGHLGRSPVHTDAIEAEIVSGTWQRPALAERVQLSNGSSIQWKAINTNTNGWFEADVLNNGYAYVPVIAQSDCIMVLDARGDYLVYVNGEPRPGDPYQTGYVRLPVQLHAGTNDLLFLCTSGRFKFNLVAPSAAVSLNLKDATLPDLIAGEKVNTWGAVVIVNATAETQTGLAIRASVAGKRAIQTAVPPILPFSIRKVGFQLKAKVPDREEAGLEQIRAVAPDKPTDASGETSASLQLTLLSNQNGEHTALDQRTIRMRIRRIDQIQKRTFISDIDGSVQYWALNPALPLHPDHLQPALFFSLHGAGVEALGQAEAYEPKTWGDIVVPTNRRPFGFDWEDWGRLDALEVLNIAKTQLHPDPQRIYLTGHSMGGHGAWQLGALFPGYFAADGVSAGWISFFSYTGAARFTNPTPIEAILRRAAATSDTLLMKSNFLQEGVYILHGSDDDNVPVTEARHMKAELAAFDPDVAYHEQPGVSHWWDISDEPGADCVDWPPMFDYFARHVIPADDDLRDIHFTTVNPGVSATCHWLEIEQQIHELEPSSIDVRWDPGKRRFAGTTANIQRLAFDLRNIAPGKPIAIEFDGQTLKDIPWPINAHKLWLQNSAGRWTVTTNLPSTLKGPLRYGPFKDAFRHHMIFVYGTKGTSPENAWAFAKARFDAETFWCRGNGSVDVIPDREFDPRSQPDRGVILYGNAHSNGAWMPLLSNSPVQVTQNQVRIGNHVFTGEGLACLFLRPRPGSDVACVGVISGTGLAGMKLTNRLNYFLSGVAYPDCTVIGPEMLSEGVKGVRAAGFFGVDWSVDKGDFAWLASP